MFIGNVFFLDMHVPASTIEVTRNDFDRDSLNPFGALHVQLTVSPRPRVHVGGEKNPSDNLLSALAVYLDLCLSDLFIFRASGRRP